MTEAPIHVPVMAAEVVRYLRPQRGGLFLDCTVGTGGHSEALLHAGATRVIGLDRDAAALHTARSRLREWRDRVELVHTDYRDFASVLDARRIELVDGAVADLGASSLQLDDPARGFSFRQDGPLDMRMDRAAGPTAAELIRDVATDTLADIIYRYGEERHSRRIARAIVRARESAPVRTTGQLAAVVRGAVARRSRSRIDPATRTFQALRIWVNRELEGLDAFLTAVCGRVAAGARLAVMTFHSLEDRIVKHTFRALGQGEAAPVRILTKRPVVAADDEVRGNPRARSAKLRVVERV